jgi:hypothetical protein
MADVASDLLESVPDAVADELAKDLPTGTQLAAHFSGASATGTESSRRPTRPGRAARPPRPSPAARPTRAEPAGRFSASGPPAPGRSVGRAN